MSIYTPTDWINNTTPSINEDNLNNMEDGIKSAHEEIEDIASGTVPVPIATNDVHSIAGGGGASTLRLDQIVTCSQAEYDALTPIPDCCYLILGA